MFLFDRLRVGSKLMLLVGVPVLGILALAVPVVGGIRERAQAVAGLDSIEDLARLTERTLRLVDELQWERAEVTYRLGLGSATPELQSRELHTDNALAELGQFLAQRDEAKLPPKLREDLAVARRLLATLPELRSRAAQGQFELLGYLDFFANVNDALIAATAGITELSEDKQIMLSIGGLVSAMQVIERNSREHALLNYVFAKQDFPPGSFRELVTLLAEQEVYSASLHTWASAEEFARLDKALKGPEAAAIATMRKAALEVTDGSVGVDARGWFDTQSANMRSFADMERDMAGKVRAITTSKVAAARGAIRVATALVLGVVFASLLLGWTVARKLTRSVRVLSSAAERVHQNHDFSIRAERTSADELGLLTDAFNGMLAGIQARDRELDAHRQNLEALVEARTRQLSERNEEMRLVLDSVDQGLAMIDRDGKLLGESSRAFARAFGKPKAGTPFYEALARDDAKTSYPLEAGYEQVMAEVLPFDVAIAQLPSSIMHEGHQYALSFTPVMHTGRLRGTLLVTRDITQELVARRIELEQRERARIFERVMHDAVGFQEFVEEGQRLMDAIARAGDGDRAERMRDLHTLKGAAGVFDVASVSEAAHALEQAEAQSEHELAAAAWAKLSACWQAFLSLVAPALDSQASNRLEISMAELGAIAHSVRENAPQAVLLEAILRLTHEPVAQRFARIAEQVQRVARRLGKPEPEVIVEAADVRLPRETYREFWSSLAHVVRNIVDHALESEQERSARGKPATHRVELVARANAARLTIEIADDGRGIDWVLLAERASQRGLPANTRADLIEALFADGVTTAGGLGLMSGRGVGLSAVRQACAALSGTIQVESEPGRGARWQFRFPPVRFAEDEVGRRTTNSPLARGKSAAESEHQIAGREARRLLRPQDEALVRLELEPE
jgi:two-component system chemotaxis sensor kinase CheA